MQDDHKGIVYRRGFKPFAHYENIVPYLQVLQVGQFTLK